MVEVYFDKEMVRALSFFSCRSVPDIHYCTSQAAYIDKKDFLNAVVREKKRFEMALDDAVAQGLNAGVNILMNQVSRLS